jgi:hypothetical protein
MTPAHATYTHAVGLRHLCLRLLQIQLRRGEVAVRDMRERRRLSVATPAPLDCDSFLGLPIRASQRQGSFIRPSEITRTPIPPDANVSEC